MGRRSRTSSTSLSTRRLLPSVASAVVLAALPRPRTLAPPTARLGGPRSLPSSCSTSSTTLRPTLSLSRSTWTSFSSPTSRSTVPAAAPSHLPCSRSHQPLHELALPRRGHPLPEGDHCQGRQGPQAKGCCHLGLNRHPPGLQDV